MKDEFFKNCVVLDTETTDIDYKVAEVIEYGYILNVDGNWQDFNELYKPMEDIKPECSAITNITNAMVKDKPHFNEAIMDTEALFLAMGDECICVAHNSFYDRKVLENYGIKQPRWLCTLDISRKLYHDDDSVSQHNLPYLRYRFGILDPAYHPDIDAHRASADALVTAILLEKMVAEMESRGILEPGVDYYDQITAWLDEPIIYDKMPFGKYKGKKLSVVPMSYWTWALDNMDTLNEEHEKYDKHFAASVMAAIECQL